MGRPRNPPDKQALRVPTVCGKKVYLPHGEMDEGRARDVRVWAQTNNREYKITCTECLNHSTYPKWVEQEGLRILAETEL